VVQDQRSKFGLGSDPGRSQKKDFFWPDFGINLPLLATWTK
jgi:hypothetical protein